MPQDRKIIPADIDQTATDDFSFPSLSAGSQTINQSVTWPDGSTTTTSPGGGGGGQAQAFLNEQVADPAPIEPLGTWSYDTSNPVMGPSFGYDGNPPWTITAIRENGEYKILYGTSAHSGYGLATSSDGTNWTNYSGNPVLTTSSSGWDSSKVWELSLVKVGGTYHLYYAGINSSGTQAIGHATSTDLKSWSKDSSSPVLSSTATWESSYITVGSGGALWDGARLVLMYAGQNNQWQIGQAVSYDFGNFTKYSGNPIISSGSGNWDNRDPNYANITKIGGSYLMWWNGHDLNANNNHSIGVGWSPDTTTWARAEYVNGGSAYGAYPQLVPSKDVSGTSDYFDNALVRNGKTWHMFMRSQANGSEDGIHHATMTLSP